MLTPKLKKSDKKQLIIYHTIGPQPVASGGRPVETAVSPRGSPYSYYARLMSGIVARHAIDIGAFGVTLFLAADPEGAIRAVPFLESPFMAARTRIRRRLGIGPFLFPIDGFSVAARDRKSVG